MRVVLKASSDSTTSNFPVWSFIISFLRAAEQNLMPQQRGQRRCLRPSLMQLLSVSDHQQQGLEWCARHRSTVHLDSRHAISVAGVTLVRSCFSKIKRNGQQNGIFHQKCDRFVRGLSHHTGLECATLSSPSFTRLCFPRG